MDPATQQTGDMPQTDQAPHPEDAEQGDVGVADVVELLRPPEGVPPVTADPEALAAVAARFAAGRGPVAVDAERASGFRYSARAYLVQLRREGAGTALVDPIACGGDLSVLGDALRGVEWVLHAASQDLACLAEVGMVPDSLFDTELAGRLAGRPRVGLGPLAESLLGVRLQKGHGAADWSRRPLPADWLVYAALDVELLVAMRDLLEADLRAQGKDDWAREEFEAVRTAPPPPPRVEPWRRVSGLHKVRRPRQLAAVRALWVSRDALATERDVAPGRLLPDAAIVEAALREPADREALAAMPVFRGRAQRRLADRWWGAIAASRELPREELPGAAATADGPPPANRWGDKDPDAAARLAAARAGLADLGERWSTPVENLLQPDRVRRLCWSPPVRPDPDTGPTPQDESAVDAALAGYGARPWQRALAVGVLTRALTARPAASADTPSADTPTDDTAAPASDEPTPAEPTPAEPTPAEPTPAEPTPAEPTPAEPTPAEPVAAETAPAETVTAAPPRGAVPPGRPLFTEPQARGDVPPD